MQKYNPYASENVDQLDSLEDEEDEVLMIYMEIILKEMKKYFGSDNGS